MHAISRRAQPILRYTGALAPMAKLVDATDLSGDLSALQETGDAELLKVGETSQVAIPSQARRTNVRREGVETRRAAPKANASPGERQGEGIVQTTN